MIWAVAGVFALVVGANAVMIAIALDVRPHLVSESYYEDAKRHDEWKAVREAGMALGWRVTPDAANATREGISLTVRDAAGRPVAGLSGRATAYRPADASLDQSLAVAPVPGMAGVYRLRFARPASGHWRLTLTLQRADERLVHDVSIVLP